MFEKIVLSKKKTSSLLLLFLLLTACRRQPQDILPPTVEYQNFTLERRSFGETQVKTNFKITNRNPFSLQGEAHYKFYLGENEIFSGSSSRLNLAAGQTKDLQLQNYVNLFRIFSSVTQLLFTLESDTDQYLPFSLKGQFNSGVHLGWFYLPVSVPIMIEGRIPLPKAPEFKVDRVNFEGMNFYPQAMVKIGVDISIKNKNNMPINLADFGYQLYHGSKELLSGKFSGSKQIPAKETGQHHFVVSIPVNQLNADFVEQLKAKKVQDFSLKRLFNDYPQ